MSQIQTKITTPIRQIKPTRTECQPTNNSNNKWLNIATKLWTLTTFLLLKIRTLSMLYSPQTFKYL
jgi:hypothetical protein